MDETTEEKAMNRDYSEEYDAYYNLHTGEWLEDKCDDPTCSFCVNRPEKLNVQIDYHESIRQMNKGSVVQYVGTVNGNVWTAKGGKFCMQRGVIFSYVNGVVIPYSYGTMVYDPDFRYKLTGETVEPRGWPNK